MAGPEADCAGTSTDVSDLREKVVAADILVVATPIWLGERSSRPGT